MNDDGKIVHLGTGPDAYSTTFVGSRAADWIASMVAQERPFFAWVGFDPPHEPATPADAHAGAAASMTPPSYPRHNPFARTKPQYIRDLPAFDDIAGTHEWIADTYRKMLESLIELDHQLGAIIAALGSELANTYIIFTADHGLLLGQHGIPYAKVAPYDPSIRVPLVIRGPGVIEGFSRPELVGNIDLTATILELAGATPLRTGDGKSLVRLLGAQEPVRDFRTHLLVEFMEDHLRPWTAPGGPAGPTYVIPKYACVRSHAWKYVKYDNASREVELYDMVRDPHELNNRHHDDGSAAEQELASILSNLARCTGTECQVVENATAGDPAALAARPRLVPG